MPTEFQKKYLDDVKNRMAQAMQATGGGRSARRVGGGRPANNFGGSFNARQFNAVANRLIGARMARERQDQDADYRRQVLVNRGNLEEQESRNAGSLAEQGLRNQGAMATTKFTQEAQNLREGNRLAAEIADRDRAAALERERFEADRDKGRYSFQKIGGGYDGSPEQIGAFDSATGRFTTRGEMAATDFINGVTGDEETGATQIKTRGRREDAAPVPYQDTAQGKAALALVNSSPLLAGGGPQPAATPAAPATIAPVRPAARADSPSAAAAPSAPAATAAPAARRPIAGAPQGPGVYYGSRNGPAIKLPDWDTTPREDRIKKKRALAPRPAPWLNR